MKLWRDVGAAITAAMVGTKKRDIVRLPPAPCSLTGLCRYSLPAR